MANKGLIDPFTGTSIEFDEKEGPAILKLPGAANLRFNEDSARMIIRFLQYYIDERQEVE